MWPRTKEIGKRPLWQYKEDIEGKKEGASLSKKRSIMHSKKFSNTRTKEGDYGFGGQGEQVMVSKVQGALG